MNCLFCSLVERPELHNNPEDEILEETQDFYAKPALGHFIEGYTLINSKKHYKNFAFLSADHIQQYENFKQQLVVKLKNIYDSPIIIFEHGGVSFQDRPGACGGCIDHAHMHLIPFDRDISGLLEENFSFEIIDGLTELQKYQSKNLAYLYYESMSGEKFVFRVNEKLPSQFLRRVICDILGQPDSWNWATHPFRDKIHSFKKRYSTFQS